MVFLSAIVPNPEYSRNAGILTRPLPLVCDLGQVAFEAAAALLRDPLWDSARAFAAGFGCGRRRVSNGVYFPADPTAGLRKVLL